IPNSDFLHSYTLEGGLVSPVFDPQMAAAEPGAVVLFGSADAERGVLRIARRSPLSLDKAGFTVCRSGTNAGEPCTQDTDCPDSSCPGATCQGGAQLGMTCLPDADCPKAECGAGLFDFRTALARDGGTLIASRSNNNLQLTALDPVPLE